MKKSKKGLQPLQPLHRICKSLIIFILNDNDSHLFFVFFQKKIWVLGFTLCMTVRIVKKILGITQTCVLAWGHRPAQGVLRQGVST